jgi:hypothetical protein
MAQLQDDYWMDRSHYTVYVVVLFGLLPFARHALLFARARQLPPFDFRRLFVGALFGLGATISFYFGLSDQDWLRHWHGVSHLLFGGCLYFLWGVFTLAKPEKNKSFI